MRRHSQWQPFDCRHVVARVLAVFGVLLADARVRSRSGSRRQRIRLDAIAATGPPDAAVVLTVEGLRDQLHAFTSSRLLPGFKQLPAVQTWIESEKAQQLRQSRDQIEAVLGIKLSEICDDLIGDAVVLALRLSPEAPADASQARGLLLFQARNSALLERLIDAVNDKQKEGGELARVSARNTAEPLTTCASFLRAASRPSEWYVTYPDGTFAFSNSESLIQSVIDRKARNADASHHRVRRAGGNPVVHRRRRAGRSAALPGRQTPPEHEGSGCACSSSRARSNG